MSKSKFNIGDRVIVKSGFQRGRKGKVSNIDRTTVGTSRRLWYRVDFDDGHYPKQGMFYSYEIDPIHGTTLCDIPEPKKEERITFHEEVVPGHAVIHPGGAISWVRDWDKPIEQPKKDKPIQMVEFREQDIIPSERQIRINNWNLMCDDYLYEFCIRHGYRYEPDNWTGGEPGTIIEIADMFVSMDNIRYDVDNNIDPELFSKWYWKNLDVYELTGENYMNYSSYCKGAPDPWTEERMQSIRGSKRRIEKAKQELEEEINRIKNSKFKKYF